MGQPFSCYTDAQANALYRALKASCWCCWGSEIVLHPTADGVSRYFTAEVAGDYAGLLRLVHRSK